MIKLNKKGSSLTGWAETILFSLGFLAVFGIVIAAFNGLYGKTNVVPLVDTATESAFTDYISNSTNSIDEGEVLFTQQDGIALKTSYSIIKGILNIVWNFISGGWIEQLASLLQLGEAALILARILRIIYFISVILILIYVIFKVVP